MAQQSGNSGNKEEKKHHTDDKLFTVWFENIYHRYFEQLYRYAFTITKDKFQAEDVVAEVFTNLWSKKPNYEDIKEPIAYLHVSVKHLAIRQVSKDPHQFTYSEYTESLHISDCIDPESLLLGKELEQLIKAILDELPPHSKVVYELARHKSYSYKKISEELDISIRTVETHMYHVLRKLKEGLREYYQKSDDAYRFLGKIVSLFPFTLTLLGIITS